MDPSLRAGDADRDRTTRLLHRAYAEGRLTRDELDERLSACLAARTMGELDGLTADLPHQDDNADLPVPASRTEFTPARVSGRTVAVRSATASWAFTSALCVLIWLLTSPGDYFWPIWVIGPWGLVLLAGAVVWPKDRRR